MKQLTKQNIEQIHHSVTRPHPHVLNADIGIVHIGAGAFFRSHQAWYTDQAMSQQAGNWAISAVSLHSNQVKQALQPQDGLYTLVEMEQFTNYSIVGSIKEVLCYQEQKNSVITRISDPKTKIVTLTITEKGYCLDHQHRLNWNSELLQQDLSNPTQPQSVIGLLALVCSLRKQNGIKTLKVISCDNIPGNGQKLKAALLAYVERVFPEISAYVEHNVICPCTMVDSITPATDEALKKQIQQKFQYVDNWPIKRERFTQWVIEDIMDDDVPAWREVGVIFTKDVEAYELAKLRILNATHSALAYLGCIAQVDTVFDAISQPVVKQFVEQMMHHELAVSFQPPPGLDINAYCQQIVTRYQNPAIKHLLAQIAWDGSQKLPVRLLPVIEHNLAKRLDITCCVAVVAAWIHFVITAQRQKRELVDPMSAELLATGAMCDEDHTTTVQRFLALPIFSDALREHPEFQQQLAASYQTLTESANSLAYLKEIIQ